MSEHSLSHSIKRRYGEGCSPRFSFRRLSSVHVSVGGRGEGGGKRGGGGGEEGEREEEEEEEREGKQQLGV